MTANAKSRAMSGRSASAPASAGNSSLNIARVSAVKRRSTAITVAASSGSVRAATHSSVHATNAGPWNIDHSRSIAASRRSACGSIAANASGTPRGAGRRGAPRPSRAAGPWWGSGAAARPARRRPGARSRSWSWPRILARRGTRSLRRAAPPSSRGSAPARADRRPGGQGPLYNREKQAVKPDCFPAELGLQGLLPVGDRDPTAHQNAECDKGQRDGYEDQCCVAADLDDALGSGICGIAKDRESDREDSGS